MADLDAAIRAALDEYQQGDPPQFLCDAIEAALDAAARWERGIDGPSIVGHAFADSVRSAIAAALGVPQAGDHG